MTSGAASRTVSGDTMRSFAALLQAQLRKDVVAAGDLDQFGHPADAADQGIVPFLEIDFWLWRRPRRRGDVRKPPLETARELLGAVGRADHRAERADHREDARDIALVEDMDGDAGADEVGDDVGLQVGEGEHEIGIEREDLRDVRRDECRHPRLLAPHPRRAHGIAGDADDAVLLAEQIQRLDRLFGQADDAAGREVVHGATLAGGAAVCHRGPYLGGHCLIYPAAPFRREITENIWGPMTPLEKIQSLKMPFAELMGVTFTEADKDRVVAKMLVRPDLARCPTIHGGAVMAFADSVGAAATVINLPEDAKGTTTLESKTNFIGGAKEGARSSRPRPPCIGAAAPRSGPRGSRPRTASWSLS